VKKMIKLKYKKSLFVLTLALLVLAVGLRYRVQAPVQAIPPVWVDAVEVKKTRLPLEVNAIGTLTAQSVEVTPEVAGRVETVFFTDGHAIKKGEPIIQLDDTIYRAKYESVKADLAYKEGNFKRMSSLAKKGVLSKDALDQAEAILKQKRAELQETEAMLGKMKLTAPFDGVLGKSDVNPGDYVNAGKGVVTLTDIGHLRVEYAVPEKYVSLLKQGQAVTVMSASYPDDVFSGKLSFISPTINVDNRSIALYANIDNSHAMLKAGMFVNVMLELGQEEDALVVPVRSLVPILDGEQVYKVTEGKAYAVTVHTAKRTENEVQVIDGLSAGDLIITDGQLKLRNGMPIKIKS